MSRTGRVADHGNGNRVVRRRSSAWSSSVTNDERRKHDWYPPTVCAAMGWSALTGAVATVTVWLTWAGARSSLDEAGFILLLATAGGMFGVLIGVVAISISAAARAIARRLSASRTTQAAVGAVALLVVAVAEAAAVLLAGFSTLGQPAIVVVVLLSVLGATGYYLRVTERIPWWSPRITDRAPPPR